jgi:threonine aldolase
MAGKTEAQVAAARQAELRASCTRFLSGHLPRSGRAWLQDLAASPLAELSLDRYGKGPAIQALEAEVAQLLGKEAAIFMHKGVIAQQAALRVWTDRSNKPTVALHPKSHIDLDEANAYERLHHLRGIRLGKDHQPFMLADLQTVHEPLGVVTLELPLRAAGYKLLAWDELVAISEWTHAQNIPLHFDGARLWESGPFYGRSYADICALADSVYVSFYKGLGGLAGCVLAGAEDFIEATRVWQSRMGGNIFTIFPMVIAASEGLKHHLPKMEQYCHQARELASALSQIPGVMIAPNPPHTNAFQIYMAMALKSLQEATLQIAASEKIWLFNYFEESFLPNLTMSEITVGEATEKWSTAEVVEAIQKLLALSA